MNNLVETLFDRLAQLEIKPLGDTLALTLVKTLVNKLFNSLAVVKIKIAATLGARKGPRTW